MYKEVIREYEDHCSGNTGQNTAPRVADSERRGNTDNDQARPRQRQPILEMSAKRRQQRRRKVRIKMQILAQFRYAQGFRLNVRDDQSERCFAPVLDRKRRTKLFLGNVSSR